MVRKPTDRDVDNGTADFKPRRAERVVVDGHATIGQQNWYDIEVTIRDVSSFGFKAECAEPIRIGSEISLDVPGVGLIAAQVRWQIGTRMGGMFLNPISLERCQWTATRASPPLAAA
jgi:hypothetical protein